VPSLAAIIEASNERLSLGIDDLNQMCSDGVLRHCFILVSGATSTGKTMMVTEFIKAAIKAGQRSLLFEYKENYGQIVRNAAAWGIDFKGAEENGLLKILCEYPARRGMEDHLIHMQSAITDFEPERIAIDSISPVERITPRRAFREFV